ncbi:hypothetical protein [Pantoea sp. SS70]|uniref:hypothetical protein n=1 Tax=Pantoea sp. SS70 TaxID=3024247 RepID=UPI002453642A|nr:hypothetical protein [Pantoea sp. SS70]WGK59967.1 hypothetical protein PO881_23655 [Pantoea sp. SS70]
MSLRTYKDYENAERVKRSVAMATVTLSLINFTPALKSDQLSKDLLLQMLQKMTAEVSGKENWKRFWQVSGQRCCLY